MQLPGAVLLVIGLTVLHQYVLGVNAASDSRLVVQKQSYMPLKSCYEDILELNSSVPTVTRELRPLLLSNARLNVMKHTVIHQSCGNDHSRFTHAWPIPHRGHKVKLVPVDSTVLEKSNNTCSVWYSGMTVALTRVRPLKHFGHRMLADLPALFMLRKFFLDQGLDVAHIKVMFTGEHTGHYVAGTLIFKLKAADSRSVYSYMSDTLGQPAWGPENFKPILEGLGYHSYQTQIDPGATLCFQQLVLMPVTFYSKWFKSGQGPPLNMWEAPEMLFDMDAIHLDMVGHIRASLGLESKLPFAPIGNQTRIVMASRDRVARTRHGHRQQRLLLNEGDLVKALSGLPGVQVEQIEFSSLTMPEVVRLLNRTSLFVGYHGAAFDNCVFLPRGAYILEILPQGTTHAPLYPALAHRTGKEFVRYVNTNVTRQSCQRVDKDGKDYQQEKCLDHVADLIVDIDAVLSLVKSVLQVQSSALTLHEFDKNV